MRLFRKHHIRLQHCLACWLSSPAFSVLSSHSQRSTYSTNDLSPIHKTTHISSHKHCSSALSNFQGLVSTSALLYHEAPRIPSFPSKSSNPSPRRHTYFYVYLLSPPPLLRFRFLLRSVATRSQSALSPKPSFHSLFQQDLISSSWRLKNNCEVLTIIQVPSNFAFKFTLFTFVPPQILPSTFELHPSNSSLCTPHRFCELVAKSSFSVSDLWLPRYFDNKPALNQQDVLEQWR